jgi:SAM-dependent methyltransferase
MPSLFSPFFLSDRALRQTLSPIGAEARGTLVDIGCGTQPYRELFGGTQYIGIEIPARSAVGSRKLADVFFDGYRIPLSDHSADFALCSQVLEHVFDPDRFLLEISRILRPGGQLIITVPFLWDEHEQPYDFSRYSSFGLRHLASKAGFKVEAEYKTLADASVLVQLALAYCFKASRRLVPSFAKPLMAAVSLPANLLGIAASWLPRNEDLYLDNVMVWRVPTKPNE